MRKKNYISPRIEIIEVENEGVMAASTPGFGGGGDWASNSVHHPDALSRELTEPFSFGMENMIKNI